MPSRVSNGVVASEGHEHTQGQSSRDGAPRSSAAVAIAGSSRMRCLAWILLLTSSTVLLYVFTAPPVLIMGPKMLSFNNPNPTSARNSSIPGEVPVPLDEDSLLECPLNMPDLVQGHSPSAGCKPISAAEAASLLASTLGGTFKPAVLFPALKTAGSSKLDMSSQLLLTLQAMLMLARQFPTWLGVALAAVAYILYIRGQKAALQGTLTAVKRGVQVLENKHQVEITALQARIIALQRENLVLGDRNQALTAAAALHAAADADGPDDDAITDTDTSDEDSVADSEASAEDDPPQEPDEVQVDEFTHFFTACDVSDGCKVKLHKMGKHHTNSPLRSCTGFSDAKLRRETAHNFGDVATMLTACERRGGNDTVTSPELTQWLRSVSRLKGLVVPAPGSKPAVIQNLLAALAEE